MRERGWKDEPKYAVQVEGAGKEGRGIGKGKKETLSIWDPLSALDSMPIALWSRQCMRCWRILLKSANWTYLKAEKARKTIAVHSKTARR
jgi:hypothetical protein